MNEKSYQTYFKLEGVIGKGEGKKHSYNTFFLKKNKETKQEKVKLKLQHVLSINKYSLGQKDTAENKTNKNMM